MALKRPHGSSPTPEGVTQKTKLMAGSSADGSALSLPSTSSASIEIGDVRSPFVVPLKTLGKTEDDFSRTHKDMDRSTYNSLARFRHNDPCPSVIFDHVLNECAELDRKWCLFAEADELLSKYPGLEGMLRACWEKGTFKDVRDLEILWPPQQSNSRYNRLVPQLAWTREFRGDAADALWSYILHYWDAKESTVPYYPNYADVIQSSGMGKSRLVDELSKTHFVIPMNLRKPNVAGFPASDKLLYEFWNKYVKDQREALLRSYAFLRALFIEAKTVVESLYETGVDESSLPSHFREFMTQDQTVKDQGPKRRAFYNKVVRRANLLIKEAPRKGKNPSQDFSLDDFSLEVENTRNADVLADAVKQLANAIFRNQKSRAVEPTGPLVVLAFDDAHTLTVDRYEPETDLLLISELRRAFRTLRISMMQPSAFGLFLSTTGRITQSAMPTKPIHSSCCVFLGSFLQIEPFSDLGFDQFATKIDYEEEWTLRDVAKDSHMVTLGRPLFATRYYPTEQGPESQETADDDADLKGVRAGIVEFAAHKLLDADSCDVPALSREQKLAILSHRLPVEFSPTYAGEAQQKKQLKSHLRVAMKIEKDFCSMQSVCPSEPILAEGAWSVMLRKDFDAPKALLSIVNGFAVHQGDRGELVALLLLILARDAAVAKNLGGRSMTAEHRVFSVTTFLECLFRLEGSSGNVRCDDILEALPSAYRTKQEASRALKDTFADAKMHFNHFIKVHELSLLRQNYLLFFASRGIGILSPNSQAGIDAFIPFTYRDDRLQRGNMGVILLKFKTDHRYTANIRKEEFDLMDPYDFGLFCEEKDAAVPLIRIVFAMGGRAPSLKTRPPAAIQNLGTGWNGDTPKRYTAYDIWCSGLTSEVYAPISESSEEVWRSILHSAPDWRTVDVPTYHKFLNDDWGRSESG
ncbi:hypothetical protein EW146_g544 [Bondarzewia mesenterica]|uniref:Uncharacterized protein n=1 Tax=Bondarzewia mesenterica TaxID=1095465 RepID=A0A4S4M6W8_9AGAM|nr:hypothetical protein EW146_g544 [Bondarzewia mesenterica]